MFNLICAEIGELGEVITVVVCIVFFIARIVSKSKGNQSSTSSQSGGANNYPFSNHPNDQGVLTEGQRSYQASLKQRKGTQKPTTAPAQTTADSHSHMGTVESYDPIVGSLGDVSTEGCSELSGVRLIVNDLMYETEDHQKSYNLDAIRKSIILGEILNNPRFKKPYGKK